MAKLSPYKPQFFEESADGSGAAFLVGGKLYSYLAGTTTPTPTYTDESGTTPNTNPVVLDARGEANVWIDETIAYKFVLTDSDDVQIWSLDNVRVGEDLAIPGGADLIGFLQAGTGAVARTVQSKLREYIDLEDFGDVDTTGAVEATSIFNLACAACAAQGKGLSLPAGTILLDATALPVALPAIIGRGETATTLRFKRQAYASGTKLLNADNNTASIRLEGFGIDTDDPQFKASLAIPFSGSGSDGLVMRDIRFVGTGDAAVRTGGNGQVFANITFEATGTAGNRWQAPFYGDGCMDCVAFGLKASGAPAYGFAWANSEGCMFLNCSVNETSDGFGIWLAYSDNCQIIACRTSNTDVEGINITSGNNNIVGLNNLRWDNSHGTDAGISINGETLLLEARNNLIAMNTVENSFHAGLLCANQSQYNRFTNNIVHNCGVRGTAAGGTGSGQSSVAQYTDIAGLKCDNNTFNDNTVVTETGAVTYGYGEFNAGGGGSTILTTRLKDNRIALLSGTPYLFASTTSFADDGQVTTWSPTISSTTGALGAATLNAAVYERDGDFISGFIDVTITNNGTGGGAIRATLPVVTVGRQGAAYGREDLLTGSALTGLCQGANLDIYTYNNAYPGSTGARIVVNFRYRVV